MRMRKIYSFLSALTAVLFCTTAFAGNSVTINVDDASRVSVVVNYEPVSIQTGDNTITSDEAYTYVQISTTSSDYGLTSVDYTYTDGTTGSLYVSSNMAGFSLSQYTNGAKYTVTSFSYAELRTAKCTVRVDDASKVILRRNGYDIPLQDGDNEVAFIPDGANKELPLTINGQGSLYKVLLNNVEQTANWGTYYLKPANNDLIEVQANWPDKDVPVTFTAGNAGTESFISQVLVDGKEVTNWNTNNFTAKLGSTVEFVGNTTDFKVDSIFINGEKLNSFYNRSSIFLGTEEAQTIVYYVTKYASFNITVNIDHADRITLQKVIKWNKVDITGLKDGVNVLELPETCTGLYFTVKGGCKVESFTDKNGTDYKDYPAQYKNIPVEADAEFTVTTWEIEREASVVFYIDNPSIAAYGGNVTFIAGESYDDRTTPLVFMDNNTNTFIDGGYYTLAFNPDFDNPMQINLYGIDLTPTIYQCDTLVKGGTSARVTIADKDVVKVYLAKPDTVDVTFSVTEGAAPVVVRDLIVPVEDLTQTLPVLAGTQIDIKALSVKANGTELVADEEGIFSVTVTEKTVIEIGDNEETAIQNANTVSNRNVYNLQGMLLIKDATPAQISALPAGLYIISGKTTYLLQH